jgi:hypothetical protein
LLPFSPAASVEDQRLLTLSQDDSIILSQKRTYLSNLIAKNVGENYTSKLEIIKISEIIPGIFYCIFYIKGNWRQIWEDSVETIIKSVERNNILEDHFGLIMTISIELLTAITVLLHSKG